MASRTTVKRIEPSFGGASTGDELSVSAEDRVVRPAKQKSRSAGKGAKGRGGRASRRRGGLFGWFGKAVYWSLVLGLWGGIAAAGLVVFYAARMPSATTWEVPDRAPNVKIVAVDGMLIANRGANGGEAVGLHEMSPFIPMAVVAIEDRRFYDHFGVDPIGLARAFVQNVLEGRVAQGGSTLTQQLAKNLFLKPERTIERKVQEVMLALWLERQHSKEEILELYLNRVYFGSGSYGVEAASRRYFGVSARNVTLSQAAVLAGLLKAPSRLSPARDPEAAEERAQVVLAAMRDQGAIADTDLASAMSAPAARAAAYWTGSENYVADRVMDEVPDLIGEVGSDIIVETTVDQTLQHFAELSIRTLIDQNGAKNRVSQGALVSIDNSGAIRAMVGGHDYAKSQFDRASEARRQPGSAFKPFVFQAALEQGARPDSTRNDAPVAIGKWRPENYEGKYYGRVTLTDALAKSLNSVAAQLARDAGVDRVIEVAHRMGINSKLDRNASIALGTSDVTPLELTAAYVPYANGGFKADLHFIRRITNPAGEVLYEFKPKNTPRVVRPDIVGMMNAMMMRTVEAGTAKRAAFGWPAAGKTGTTQNARDAWFVGYTANLTTGVWFGNDDGRPMKNATGGSLATIAWHDFMAAAHEGLPPVPLPGVEFYRAQPKLDAIIGASAQKAVPLQAIEPAGFQRDEAENPATGAVRRPA
ncbi:MAG TPA: transglycosylase domain-containing protein, partial [Tianweitania sediminis]|nr:transglycosylase domain-containing protein [Tianweitania sediminis]